MTTGARFVGVLVLRAPPSPHLASVRRGGGLKHRPRQEGCPRGGCAQKRNEGGARNSILGFETREFGTIQDKNERVLMLCEVDLLEDEEAVFGPRFLLGLHPAR